MGIVRNVWSSELTYLLVEPQMAQFEDAETIAE
jgi:hypothetical protein